MTTEKAVSESRFTENFTSESNKSDCSVFLKSSDGVIESLPYDAAITSELVKMSIECDDEINCDLGNPIELPNVDSSCLKKIVEFLIHYNMETMTPIQTPFEENNSKKGLQDVLEENVPQVWYRNFVNEAEESMIFKLGQASNYMEIPPLLDLTFLFISIGLMGKSAEEIRVILNIPKMTSEEEATARLEHRWIFED